MSRIIFAFAVLLAGSACAADSGPNYPTVVTATAGTGTLSWTNPTYALSDDGNLAHYAYASTAVAGTFTTKTLYVSGFGFSVPAGKGIVGILVEYKCGAYTTSGGSATAASVRLVNAAAAEVGDNKATGIVWPTLMTYRSYGGSSDAWNAGLSVADVNSANFGVAVYAIVTAGTDNFGIAEIDVVRATITYADAAGQVGQSRVQSRQRNVGPTRIKRGL